MRTFSDLLGTASEDEELKEAFHAQARQSAILAALVTASDTRQEKLKEAFHAQARQSAILGAVTARDTREEAYCHHPRKSERQPVRPKPRHTVFISAFAVAVLGLGFGGGYLLLADALTEPNEGAKVAEVMARGPPTIAAARPPAPTGATEQEEPPGTLAGASIAPVLSTATDAAERGDVAGNAENAPAPSLPGSGVEVAKVTQDTRAAIDRPDVKTGTDKNSATVEPPGQNQNQDTAGALSTIAAAQPPAPADTTEQEEPAGKLEGAVVPSIAPAPSTATDAAKSGDAAGDAENGPAPSLPRPDVDVAAVTADTRSATDRPEEKTTADKLKESEGVEPPGQNPNRAMAGALSVTCQTSGPAGDGHWAWRLIDGRKCWYKGAAGMNKSLLHWLPLESAVVPSIARAPSAATGAAARGDVAGNTENEPAQSLPGSGVEYVKVTADTRSAIDRPDVKTTADKLKESEGVEPPGQSPNRDMAGALTVTCQTSGPAGDGHWAWRLIDDRKCWYKGAAGMDKSLLHWPPLEHVPELQ